MAEDSRAGFWQKAPAERKTEVALAITVKYREREDIFQQARALGAEAWGLGRGRHAAVDGESVANGGTGAVAEQSSLPAEPPVSAVESSGGAGDEEDECL